MWNTIIIQQVSDCCKGGYNLNKIIKYNLEIMSCIFAVMVVVGVSNWAELSALRQMTIIFMILYTLHE